METTKIKKLNQYDVSEVVLKEAKSYYYETYHDKSFSDASIDEQAEYLIRAKMNLINKIEIPKKNEFTDLLIDEFETVGHEEGINYSRKIVDGIGLDVFLEIVEKYKNQK